MNIIQNIIIVLILIGLFFTRKKHLDNNLLLISICFITLLVILNLLKVNNLEGLVLNHNNIEKLLHQDHQFELQPSWTSNDFYNLYLHIIPNQIGNKNDCSLSNQFKSCSNICVVNHPTHEINRHYWKFVKQNNSSLYEIKHKDKYLSVTDKGRDCKSFYPDNICHDVVLINKTDFYKDPVYWILSPQTRKNDKYYYFQIQAHFNNSDQDYYLYCTQNGEDGQDCEDYFCKDSTKGDDISDCKMGCRNVFLVPGSHKDSSKLTFNKLPMYWKFILDPASAPDSIKDLQENIIDIRISDTNIYGYNCTPIKYISNNSEYDQFLCTNKEINFKFSESEDVVIPTSYYKDIISLGKGDNHTLGIERKSKYRMKHSTKPITGYNCVKYDKYNYICLKETDEIQDDIIPINKNEINHAKIGKASVILSSSDKSNARNLIDENTETTIKTTLEDNPKVYIYLNDKIIIKKIIIRQSPSNQSQKLGFKIYNGDTFQYGQNFEPSSMDDSTYVYDEQSYTGNIVVIDTVNDSSDNDSLDHITSIRAKKQLILNNVYIIGNLAYKTRKNDDVLNAIKKEKSLCKVIQRQEKDKLNAEMTVNIMKTEEISKKKTLTDILEFINTPHSIIMWENIGNVGCKSLKLELLKKDYLHISNIQVFGISESSTRGIQKDWAKDTKTGITLSSTYTDDNDKYYGGELCVDDNIYTYCRTLNTENPYLILEFPEIILVDKIIIYNRKDKNRHRLVPCRINLLDIKENIVLLATKERFDKDLIISKSILKPPMGCLSFDELNITDIGDINRYRGWSDVEGNGIKCNYCRVVGSKDQQYFSCASSTGDNQYKYNTIPGSDLGEPNSIFMNDVSGSNKDDLCRCVPGGISNKYNQNVECLINNINEPNLGFNSSYSTTIPCNNRSGEEINDIISKKIKSTIKGEHRTDTGFYYPPEKAYYLFKNTHIDNKEMIIFVKISNETHQIINNASLLTTHNHGSWPNLHQYFSTNITSITCINNEILYFFKNNDVIKYNMKTKISYTKNPVKILDEFPNLPKTFEIIDECYYAGNNIIVFFRGNKFIQYYLNDTRSQIITSNINQGNFGKNMTFDRIDTALSFYDNENDSQEIFFTRNEQCILTNNTISDHDTKYNIIQDINTIFPNIWEININSLNNYNMSNLHYKLEPKQIVQIPVKSVENIIKNNTINRQNINKQIISNIPSSNIPFSNIPFSNIPSNKNQFQPDYSSNNEYASCSIEGNSIRDQIEILKNKKSMKKQDCSKIKIKNNRKDIIEDIINNGLSIHLKENNKDINTLSCELGTTPTKLLIHLSNNELYKILI